MLNRKAFYDSVRPHVNLTIQNVEGMEKVLDYAEARGSRINDLAYILATAWWETGQTMWPVVEAYWLSESWRKKNLRYWPWHGRGLIQTTWEHNYRTMSPVVGADLIANPNLLLEWKYALPALFVGMERGLYTGKALDDYIDGIDESDAEDFREFKNARRIVNGTDKASAIANLGLNFKKALKAGGYKAASVPPMVNTKTLKDYQQHLKDLGFDPGPIDGLWGKKTSAAVKAFQEADGALVVDGLLGPKTSDAIDMAIAQPKAATKIGIVAAGAALTTTGTVAAGFDPWLAALVGVAVAVSSLVVFNALKG